MKAKRFPIVISMLMLLSILYLPGQVYGEEANIESQPLNRWLVLGPAEVPALTKDILGGDKKILDFKHLNVADLKPVEGDKVNWSSTRVLHWDVLKHAVFRAYETGALYLATYLEPNRWMQTTLNIHNTNLGVAVFLDGKGTKEKVGKDKISVNLDLTNEKHLLVLKVLLIKGETFTFKASLQHKKAFKDEKVAVSLTPGHKINTESILNMISVRRNGIRVSPDGRRVALTLSQTPKDTGKSESWLEILNTNNGATIFSSRGLGRISGFRWMGNSSTFSYYKREKKNTSIYRYDLNSHRQTPILENIKDFSYYWWAPNFSFLVYSTSIEAESNDLYKHIKEIQEKATYQGSKSTMTIYFPAGGVSHKIGDEEEDYSDAEISPDSKYILFSKREPDAKHRPYGKNTYFLFKVAAMSVEKLFESYWVNSGQFSPDSRKLLMLGGPSSFNGIGSTLPKGVIPNDYDTQAFIYDLGIKKAEAISKQLDPAIDDAAWSSSPNNIYFKATDKSRQGLFKYSLRRKKYTRLDVGVDIVSTIGFARHRNLAVFWGCSATVPYKLYKVNLNGGKGVLLRDFNREHFRDVKIGTVKDWNFRTPEGKTIVGRIHYPPDFDSSKKYPCIVYYYGGTSPVTRTFGGRYPKNWYAANGYVVYVLQPSGATGFGQEFSAIHVNDWGKTTAVEVIGAVKQLVKSHPYIDIKRIGAMGASYGGFMTQYIATQTDIFAAYISHAGISALSSYWGVGDWGVLYSGIATADSFPWNRKDIYVGHSPLFMADRITSPILLLHGNIDNNVPPGESYQMFAALKLLGKEVSLITYKDQSHWIMDYKKRLHWMRTIIAWWDKYLKKQPQHWDKLYE
jgi:dipeptidyl aminopeptidase/acylaminoacyl peptidase